MHVYKKKSYNGQRHGYEFLQTVMHDRRVTNIESDKTIIAETCVNMFVYSVKQFKKKTTVSV